MSVTVLPGDTLDRLRELIASEGESLAPALAAAPASDSLAPLVRAAAAGRAAAGEYALVMESVLEGYLLHFGRPRLIDTADEDLRLLAGDHMYALGLSRLARLGDLDAVRALSDLITLSARHHAAGGTGGEALAALWVLTALAVGAGKWGGYEHAIAAARAGRASPAELLDEVTRRTGETGLHLEMEHALIAFRGVAFQEPQT